MLKTKVNYLHCNQCAVNHLCLPRTLDNAETEHFDALFQKMRTLQKGEHLFHIEDAMSNLYAVASGACKDYWLDANGNEHISNFYLPGDIIGLESLPQAKHFFSLTALEDSEVCVLPIEVLFEEMQKNNKLLKRVMNIASYKMQNDRQIRITTNASQRVADFIVSTLSRIKERRLSAEYIILPMSQLDISNFLGMAHETVNRILRKLHKDKIIKIENKKISVIDHDRLNELSTFVIGSGQVD